MPLTPWRTRPGFFSAKQQSLKMRPEPRRSGLPEGPGTEDRGNCAVHDPVQSGQDLEEAVMEMGEPS